MRRRIISIIFVLITILLLWFVWHQFVNLKIWAIEEINIEGNAIIPTKILKDKLNAFLGQSIFTVRSKVVKEKVKEISQLENIKIKREFPKKIIVSIVERKPFANVFYGKKNFVIDDKGYVLNKPGMLIADIENLPVVKKIKENDIISNTFLRKDYVEIIRGIICGLKGIVDEKELQIEINNSRKIILFLKEKVKVKIGGKDNIKAKLKKIKYFISSKEINFNEIEYIDVRFGSNVVVKYHDEGSRRL